jgi:TM2 domain-containing membrane protein YozV
VYWDNRKVGKTDLKIENEALGVHKLSIKKPGYKDYDGTVILKEVKDYDTKVRLSIQEYLVSIEGTPAGADVWLGDTLKVGQLPCSVTLPFGTYNFKLKAKGYHTVSGLVAIDRDQSYTLKLNLNRRSRFRAGVQSLFFPGSGQMYSGRKAMGTLYLIAWMGAMGWTGASIGAREGAANEAQDAYDDYMAATNANEAGTAYIDWEERYGEWQDHKKEAQAAIYATAGLWAFNFLDAMIFFPHKPKVKAAPVLDKSGALKTSVSLTYSW